VRRRVDNRIDKDAEARRRIGDIELQVDVTGANHPKDDERTEGGQPARHERLNVRPSSAIVDGEPGASFVRGRKGHAVDGRTAGRRAADERDVVTLAMRQPERFDPVAREAHITRLRLLPRYCSRVARAGTLTAPEEARHGE
jgi:hypothetical protein